MTDLIVPGHLARPRSTGRDSDYLTRAQVQAMIVEHVGAMALLLTEACDRIHVLEDRLGIVAPVSSSPSDASDATALAECGDIA
jgi:hypothetical protein